MKQQTRKRTCAALVAGLAVLFGGVANLAAAPQRYAAKPAAKAARSTKKRKPAPPPAPTPAPENAAPILDDEDPPAEDNAPAAAPSSPVPSGGASQAPAAGPVVNIDVSAPPVAAPTGNAKPTSSPEELRARYDELRDAVFRSRARRETVEKALFSTKVSFELKWQANRHYRIEKAELRLDGTRLWDASLRPVTEEPVTLAVRSVAPGSHVLSVRIEVKSRDSAAAGYVSEQSFAITLPEGKASKVRITVDEDGSVPSYNPEIEIEIDQ